MFLERKARATNFYVFSVAKDFENIQVTCEVWLCVWLVFDRASQSMYMLQLIFLSQVRFAFFLFLVMVLYANEVETKEK